MNCLRYLELHDPTEVSRHSSDFDHSLPSGASAEMSSAPSFQPDGLTTDTASAFPAHPAPGVNGREDDANENSPTDQSSLYEAGPEDGWVEEEGKGAEEELPVADGGFAAVEGRK